MLTVLSAMAQQESENISSHVKLGLQMKLKTKLKHYLRTMKLCQILIKMSLN